MKRKYLFFIAIPLFLFGAYSCQNQEWFFPDFDYTSTYFPYQYPVRTLELGDNYFDNTNDNNHRFVISATMGGVYKNDKDITVEYVVDETLTDNLYAITSKNDTIKVLPLPSQYYTLSNASQITIPKGSLSGGVTVQLTDAFFDDPKAIGYIGATYVVPLRIVSATTDSVLTGKVLGNTANPKVTIAANWEVQPRNFTVFGINYVNEYHGVFLLRGKSDQMQGESLIATSVYRSAYIEQDRQIAVNTVSRYTVKYTKEVPRKTGSSPGSFIMNITFDSNGAGTVSTAPGSLFQVSGTAKFMKDTESWGGKSRNAIYLDYVVNDGTYLNQVKDTLVFRNKGIGLQVYTPLVK